MGSSDVSAGDTILASQQNDLRDDIIQQFTAADEIFVSTGNDAGTVRTAITQALATAGTSTVIAGWTPLRVKQAIDALASVVSQAGQTAIEAQTNENTYIPPDLLVKSPGVAKATCHINSAGTLSSPDHGISTIDDSGVGIRGCNFSVPFSSAIYTAVSTGMARSTAAAPQFDSITSTSIRLVIVDMTDGVGEVDEESGQAFYGDT